MCGAFYYLLSRMNIHISLQHSKVCTAVHPRPSHNAWPCQSIDRNCVSLYDRSRTGENKYNADVATDCKHRKRFPTKYWFVHRPLSRTTSRLIGEEPVIAIEPRAYSEQGSKSELEGLFALTISGKYRSIVRGSRPRDHGDLPFVQFWYCSGFFPRER